MVASRCIYLAAQPDADGAVRVRKNWAYRCDHPVPEQAALPASITRYYDFKWPPIKGQVLPEDCAKCPCFTRAEDKAEGPWLF